MDIKSFIERLKKKFYKLGYDAIIKHHTFYKLSSGASDTRGFIDAALFDSIGSLEYAVILYFDTDKGDVHLSNIFGIGGCIDNLIIKYVEIAIYAGLHGEEEGE